MVGTLAANVRSRFGCFELYGFDIMLTDAFEAILIEVNAMPSLQADSALDKHIKGQLIADALTLVGVPIELTPSQLAASSAGSSAGVGVDAADGGVSNSDGSDAPLPAAFPPQQTASIAAGVAAVLDGNNVPWRPQPKNCNPRDLAFWAAATQQGDAQQPGAPSSGSSGIGAVTAEARAMIALREDQLRRRGGFDAIFPTSSSLQLYGRFMGPPASATAQRGAAVDDGPFSSAASSAVAAEPPINYQQIRFFDLLAAEWERRKELIAANGGDAGQAALRRWLLGEGPFPIAMAAADAAERRRARELQPRVAAKPSPPPVPPPSAPSASVPSSARGGGSSGRGGAPPSLLPPIPSSARRDSSSKRKKRGASSSSVPKLPSVAKRKQSQPPPGAAKGPAVSSSPTPPPTPTPTPPPPKPLSRRSSSKTVSVSKRPSNAAQTQPNIHVHTLTFEPPVPKQ